MPPSREEAALALREISNVQARVAGFQDYRFEASQLILWGVLNITGCVLTALLQSHLLLIWGCVATTGVLVGARMAKASSDSPGVVPRYLLIVLSILLFDFILHLLFWPITPRQGAMIVPLFVATLYVIRGAQSRPRYIVIGSVLATLCCCTYAFAGAAYWWLLALSWGGTLVASGCWLRRC
ncbi:hypothetical protein ACRSLK_09505 [Halopseudomonas pachastrellae]|uniref:hypothetical protein n=1 Tax=Halopseudomonas pachastrellae TaxID=254161 RepID=UPI003D7C55FA|tara:strand:+ start:261 stop:806 length:546 start_codon:yes stop_codon:yes gene_type:complete